MGKIPARPTLAELRQRREEILDCAAARGASNIRVFGSVARGEATPESDIDFVIDLAAGRTLFDLSGLILDLEEMLGRKVDVVQIPSQLVSPTAARVAQRIQHEAVPL